MYEGGSSYYYHYDPLGSVADLTSSTGATEWTESYEPYGAVHSETQNDPNAPTSPIKFAAEYLDPTGLYYLRARQYDLNTGRFLSTDPLDLGQLPPRRICLLTLTSQTAQPSLLIHQAIAALCHRRPSSVLSPRLRRGFSDIDYGLAQVGRTPPICRNLTLRSWSGKAEVDYRGHGYVAWLFQLNLATQVLFSRGNPTVIGKAYRNGNQVRSYRYDKRTEPSSYSFHSTVPGGYRSGDNFTLGLLITGNDPEGKPHRLEVHIGCIVP
jgi:RHS repeat-associated protein